MVKTLFTINMHLFFVSYLLFVNKYVILSSRGDSMENSLLCPKMEKALTLLGKKWNGLIVFSLLEEPKKFNEIVHYVNGISPRMLTERLKELENENIITKKIVSLTPLKVEYSLTKKGVDLGETYGTIQKWAEKWH